MSELQLFDKALSIELQSQAVVVNCDLPVLQALVNMMADNKYISSNFSQLILASLKNDQSDIEACETTPLLRV